MADSYLISQVVVDRATELSREPAHEQVIVLAFGATDPADERSMPTDPKKLVDYLGRSKGYNYVEDQPPRAPNADRPAPK